MIRSMIDHYHHKWYVIGKINRPKLGVFLKGGPKKFTTFTMSSGISQQMKTIFCILCFNDRPEANHTHPISITKCKYNSKEVAILSPGLLYNLVCVTIVTGRWTLAKNVFLSNYGSKNPAVAPPVANQSVVPRLWLLSVYQDYQWLRLTHHTDSSNNTFSNTVTLL